MFNYLLKKSFARVKYIPLRDWGGDKFSTKEYNIPFFFNLFVISVLLEQKAEGKWKLFINIYLFGFYRLEVFSLHTTAIHTDPGDDISLGYINNKEARPPLVQVFRHM